MKGGSGIEEIEEVPSCGWSTLMYSCRKMTWVSCRTIDVSRGKTEFLNFRYWDIAQVYSVGKQMRLVSSWEMRLKATVISENIPEESSSGNILKESEWDAFDR